MQPYLRNDWKDKGPLQISAPQPLSQKPQDNGNFFTSLLPSGGGMAGVAGGAALGTAIAPGIGTFLGALLGGAAGGGAGKVTENAVENKDLLQGVGQEALLNGVLGAGPIRLLKGGVDVARGLKAGTGLADALSNAGTNAVQGSIKGTIGNKLADISNDLVVKNFRLTPSQLSNFKTKFGEDASQTIKKYGLVGKDAAGITEDAINPLQNEFNTITQKVASVPTADVLKAFKAKYEPLLNSAVTDNKAIGQQLQQQADAIAKKYGAEIPSSELNALRQEFDGLSNYADKAANPARYGVNKRSADAVRATLQQAADNAGIKASNGMTFKQVGQELNKLRQLTDNIGRQEQQGRGANPLGLTTLLGGIGGGGVGGLGGGVVGTAAGMAATKAINSTAGRRLAAGATEKLGTRLTQKAAATDPFSLGSLTKRVGLTQAIPAYMWSGAQQPSGMDNSGASSNNDILAGGMPSSISGSYNGAPQGGAIQQDQSPYSQANLMADVQRDPKNADKYFALYQNYQKAFAAPAQPKLSSATAGAITDMYKGLQTLQDLSNLVSSGDYAGGVVQGNIRQFNPFDNQFKQQQAMIDTARQVVGKALEGGVLRKEDEEKYKKILPTMQDSPEVAASKVQYIQNIVANNLQQYSGLVGGGNSLEDALMSAQGSGGY